jgi:hypothetical protein
MRRVHPKSTHPPRFFSPIYFFYFSGVSQQVEFKNTEEFFFHVGNILPKTMRKSRCRSFRIFNCVFGRSKTSKKYLPKKHQKPPKKSTQ